jgi:hypothetical protein
MVENVRKKFVAPETFRFPGQPVNDVLNRKSIGLILSQLIFFSYFNRNVCILDSNRLIGGN